jgi:ankyrin repeat protein/type II secretory pathway predicted ATPase ExeA
MYRTHIGLSGSPFSNKLNPTALYMSTSFCNAHATLRQGINAGARLMLLLGSPGVGKTTLMQHLKAQERQLENIIYIPSSASSLTALIDACCAALEIVPERPGLEASVRFLIAGIAARAQSGIKTIVLLDAERTPPLEILENAVTVFELNDAVSASAQIVVAGQLDFEKQLHHSRFVAVKAAIDIRCVLEPLADKEVGAFIAHQLEGVDYPSDVLFNDHAIEVISKHCRGIPRTLNTVCGAASAIVCDQGLHTVTPAIAQGVIDDFDSMYADNLDPNIDGISYAGEHAYGGALRSDLTAGNAAPNPIEARSVIRDENHAEFLDPERSTGSNDQQAVYSNYGRGQNSGDTNTSLQRASSLRDWWNLRPTDPVSTYFAALYRSGSGLRYWQALTVGFASILITVAVLTWVRPSISPVSVTTPRLAQEVDELRARLARAEEARAQLEARTAMVEEASQYQNLDLKRIKDEYEDPLAQVRKSLYTQHQDASEQSAPQKTTAADVLSASSNVHEPVVGGTSASTEKHLNDSAAPIQLANNLDNSSTHSGQKQALGPGTTANLTSDKNTRHADGSNLMPGEELEQPVKNAATGSRGDAHSAGLMSAEPKIRNVNARPPAGKPYVVVRGDSLFAIANRFGITASMLRQWNKLDGDRLSVGQKLDLAEPESVRRSMAKVLLTAAAAGSVADVEQQLRKPGAAIDATDEKGNSALILATIANAAAVVELLLDQKANVNQPNLTGDTALSYAAWNGQATILASLLENGAKPNTKNHEGRTALINASINGNVRCVHRLLKNGANVNARTVDNRTALSAAVWNGHLAVARALLDAKANVNATLRDGGTPLIDAAWNGDAKMVNLLLKYGADSRRSSSAGITPLEAATQRGHVEVVTILTANKASSS